MNLENTENILILTLINSKIITSKIKKKQNKEKDENKGKLRQTKEN